jgi:glycerophosphoryl diester phosphodiesterase
MSLFDGALTVIGHRGLGSGRVNGYRENSPESIAAAVAVGLRWVEVDVRRTADDALVVGHGPLTPQGHEVAARTLDDAVSDGMWRVEDVLAVVPSDVGVVLDVKTALGDALRPAPATTAALVAPLALRQLRHRPVVVYSFDPAVLLVLRELAPGVPRGMLTWVDFPFRKAVPAAVHLGTQLVAAHTGSLLGNRIEARFMPGEVSGAVAVAHQAGLEVVAWCPSPEAALRLVAAGVDALCFNDVPSMLDRLRQAGVPLQLTPQSDTWHS